MPQFTYEDAIGAAPAAAAASGVQAAPNAQPPASPPAPSQPIYDAANNVGRNPDGSIAYVGAPSTGGAGQNGDLVVNVNSSSDPATIQAWLQAHPNDPANKIAPPAAGPQASSAPAGQNTFSYEDAAGTPSAPSAAKPDEMLGFVRELERPLDNASTWLENGIRAIPGGAAFDDALQNGAKSIGMSTDAETTASHNQMIADAAAQGRKPGQIGSIAGSVLGTAPLAMLPGGPILQGAAGGALTTRDPNNLGAVAGDAALGGVLGKVGDVAINGAVNAIAPRISPAVQALLDRNIPLTTGMISGGKGLLGRLEQLAQNIPVAGELVRKRGNEALEGFNAAVPNEALAPTGATVVRGATGHETYQNAKQAIGNAYDAVGSGAPVPLDGPYAARMAAVRASAQELPQDLAAKFAKVMNREIVGRLNPGVGGFTADGIKDAKAALNGEIAKVKNPTLFESEYVDHLKDARIALTQMLGRTSPEARAALAAADDAYPAFKAYERAIKNSTQNMTTPNGYFTPQQLQAAINSGASDSARAGGTGPLADLASAGKEVLPRRFKDVISPMQAAIEGGVGAGVIGADVLHGQHAGMAMAVPAAMTSLLYTKAIQDLFRKALVNSAGARKAFESAVGPLEKFTRPAAGIIGGVSASPVQSTLAPQGAFAR